MPISAETGSVTGPAQSVALAPRREFERSLTRTQDQIWASQRLHRGTPLANMAKLHRIHGPLDPDRLADAFEQVVGESDALRSVVIDRAGTAPHIGVLAAPPGATEILDLAPADVEKWIASRIAVPIDVTECAYDSVVLRHGDDEWSWWLDLHHLVTDAWASSEVFRATEARYLWLAGAADEPAPMPSLYDHVDGVFSKYGRGREERLLHWANVPVDETPIAPSGPRSSTTTAVERRPVAVDDSLGSALAGPYRTLSRELSLIGVLAGALASVLCRLDGRDGFTFGVPLHHRSGPIAPTVIGPLMELYPVRVEVRDGETFAELFERVQEGLLDTMRHARPGESPDLPFDAVLNVLTTRYADFAGMPTTTEWHRSGHVDPAHPIRLHAYDHGDGLQLELDLNEGLSADGLHRDLVHHLESAIGAAATKPDSLIGDVALTDADALGELARLSPERLRPRVTEPVHETIRRALRATPDEVTAEYLDRTMTAGELDERADGLASWLTEQGAVIGSRVGIRMERSLDVLVAIHGILRSGGAFVMMDPDDPASRHAAIDRDADLLLTLEELPEPAPSPGPVGREAGPDDLAYILYTSGSTGVPKGVPISHAGLTDYLDFAVESYVDESPPVMPLHSALVFDLTITSLFLPQLTGGRTIVVPGEPLQALSAVAADRRLDTLKATPGQLELLSRMIDEPVPLRTVIVGGESFRRPVAEAFARRCADDVRIFNEYGPTEAVVGCMLHEWDPTRDTDPDVPIGLACPGAQVHVLDRFRHPTPIGSWGELYVSRPGMASAYVNLPELSVESFVSVPEVSDQTLYRTGDRVRVHHGVLVYGGRMDDQLKVNGVRLDPGEVEAAITSHPGVTNAFVRTWTPAQRSHHLRSCRRCGLGSDVPGITFDETGSCSVCARYDDVAARAAEWFLTPADLDTRRDRARGRSTGDYDCLHLLSGGKDSTYALYQLAERGWRVHALTLDNGFISDGAKENIRQSVADLGITHEFVRTEAMNEIFRDSLDRYSNVCNGCYKTIYTLAVARAHELGIPVVTTGLSRGQFFETRLVPHQFEEGRFDPNAIDHTVLQARRTYHHTRDAVTELLPQQAVFELDEVDVLSEVEFVDFYRYVDVSLADLYEFLETRAPWVRPADTGRSTNCLVNVAGIHVHRTERGYHNYAEPYSWDVRLGHKTRSEALEELDDPFDQHEVDRILAEIGYEPKRPEILTAWYVTADGQPVDATLLRAHLRDQIPERVMPTAFVHVDDLPLADSAKVDVAALPAPARQVDVPGDFVPPETPTEAIVAAVWSSVLDAARVGLDDDFFDLGGASLAALETVVAVEDRLELELPDAFVFEHRTVREFAAAVDALQAGASTRAPIPALEAPGPTPLTAGEEAILFEQQSAASGPRYNVNRLYTVASPIDLDRLHDAFRTLVARHDVLRTTFDRARSPLEVDAALSFGTFPDDDHRAFAEVQRSVPFDLEHGPLVRVHAGSGAGGDTEVLIALHHAIVDAETFDLLWDEVDRAFHGRPLPELTTSVAAHGVWQRGRVGASTEFWSERRGALPDAEPAQLPTPAAPAADGLLRVDAAVSTSELAATGTTPFAVALAAAGIALRGFSRTGHVELGATASLKDHPDVAPLIGYFLNSLPITVHADGEATIHDIVMDAGRIVAETLPHRAYPYSRMVADARRAGERPPDISLFLAYQRLAPASFGSTAAHHEILPSGVSIGDLSLIVEERGESLLLGAEYSGSAVGRETAQLVLDAFGAALTACCRQPHRRVDDLDIGLGSSELVGPELGEHELVVDRILGHARSTPDSVAVRAGDEETSYDELHARARTIAAGIRAAAPTPRRVGVALHRTCDLLPAILGTWLAGAAYVPLDPAAPPARRDRIVGAAELDLVLADRDVSEWCPVPTLDLSDLDDAPLDEAVEISPDDPAYVIFTSGSTGVPAGVAVSHGNLAASTGARTAVYGDSSPDRFLVTSSIGFDSSMVGLFWPLATGGSVLLAGDDDVHDVDGLAALVDRHAATHLLMVPSLYRALLDRHSERLGSLEVAIVAGESCPAALIDRHTRLLPTTALYNEYGPTEATVWASVHHCAAGDDPVPIGRPVPGARLRVVDASGRAMSPGAIGELWISGPGVVAGYVSGRDSSVFVKRDGARWYRTGDLVRAVDGQLLFLGRVDDQLNVGGVRLEPEELEAEITALEGISDAVVTARPVEGREVLVAHVVAGAGVDPADVRRRLAARHGTIAPRIVALADDLPRTPHGKLDRSAAADLPLPSAPGGEEHTDSFVAIWRRALADPALGPDDDFFDVGGDSLAAVEIVTAVSEVIGRDVPIGVLLRSGTPRALARELGVTLDLQRESAPRIHELRRGTEDGSLVLLTAAWEEADTYLPLAAELPADVTVLALTDGGLQPDPTLSQPAWFAAAATSDLLARCAGRRVTTLGWSTGGLVAHELGRRLAAQGVEVEYVALVDTEFPDPSDEESSAGARRHAGSLAETLGEFSERGRRTADRYGRRLHRAGLALRGKAIPPPDPASVGGRRREVAADHHAVAGGVPLLLYTTTSHHADGSTARWCELEASSEVITVETGGTATTIRDAALASGVGRDLAARMRSSGFNPPEV